METDKVAELLPCPMCGSGRARGPGRFTSASFSGVELMDPTNEPYVWCGTCCLRTRTCDSIAEAIDAWNARAPAEARSAGRGGVGEDALREALARLRDLPIDENDGPNTLHLDGSSYTGPAVDWTFKIIRMVKEIASAALSPQPTATEETAP